MTDTTTRDAVWTQALVQLMDHDRVQLGDLHIADSERQTARRTLNAMEEVGLLARDPSDERLWVKGEAWHWLTRATPGHRLVWDDVAEELALVVEVVERNEGQVEEEGMQAFSGLMGECMGALRRKADGDLVSELLREEIQKRA